MVHIKNNTNKTCFVFKVVLILTIEGSTSNIAPAP